VERVAWSDEAESYPGDRKLLVGLNLVNRSELRGPGKFEELMMAFPPSY
jgi:hypothetical protein